MVLPSFMRFLRPSVPILSQKLSFSAFTPGDFGRGNDAIFLVFILIDKFSIILVRNEDVKMSNNLTLTDPVSTE